MSLETGRHNGFTSPALTGNARECPACGRAMQFRDGMRCRHCGAVVVRSGEPFFRMPGDRLPVYVWTGRRWREV